MNAIRHLGRGFVVSLLIVVVLVLAAWGLLELATWLWRVLAAASPLAGVLFALGCVGFGLGGTALVLGW